MQTASDEGDLMAMVMTMLADIKAQSITPSASEVATALLDVFAELPGKTTDGTHYKMFFCIAGLLDLAERLGEMEGIATQ